MPRKKLKPKKETSSKTGTTVKDGKIVEAWMSQDVKLSINYNSMSTTIGMKATVDKDLNKTMKTLRLSIRKHLKPRIDDMSAFLNALATHGK